MKKTIFLCVSGSTNSNHGNQTISNKQLPGLKLASWKYTASSPIAIKCLHWGRAIRILENTHTHSPLITTLFHGPPLPCNQATIYFIISPSTMGPGELAWKGTPSWSLKSWGSWASSQGALLCLSDSRGLCFPLCSFIRMFWPLLSRDNEIKPQLFLNGTIFRYQASSMLQIVPCFQ